MLHYCRHSMVYILTVFIFCIGFSELVSLFTTTSNADVNAWSFILTFPHVVMVWFFIKHMGNFAITTLIFCTWNFEC